MFHSPVTVASKHKWSRNCLPCRSIWVHPRVLVWFVLLDL